MPSNHLILCRPLLLLPSIFPNIRVFSNESVLSIRWTKYWSFSFSISPSNEHPVWSPLGWTGWISWQSKGLSRVFSNTTVQKHQCFYAQLSLYKDHKDICIYIYKYICIKLVITFLPRSKHLLILWLQSPSAVILEPPEIKSVTVSNVFTSICHEVMGPDAMILVFWMLSFKPTSSLSSFTFIKRLLSSSSLSAIRVVSSAFLRLLIFLPAILIPAYASSSSVFLMMCSAYKLNKQGDNIQPWRTPFPIWNQSVVHV